MGSKQTTNNQRKRYRTPSVTKSHDQRKYKRADRFRTTMRSITLRTIAARNYQNSVSSSYDSTINNSSLTSPTTITSINSQFNTDPYLSDFDYRKLSTLTGLAESKVNELHREFLMLSTNGRLTFDQYRSMLETIPNDNSSIQLEQLARQTFTLFDKDGNNYLDFAEFLAAYIIMEKNELFTTEKTQSPSPLPSLTREVNTYYSTQKSLVNQPTYLPTYYPSERYVYTSSQYSYR